MLSAIEAARLALPAMIDNGWDRILNISPLRRARDCTAQNLTIDGGPVKALL